MRAPVTREEETFVNVALGFSFLWPWTSKMDEEMKSWAHEVKKKREMQTQKTI